MRRISPCSVRFSMILCVLLVALLVPLSSFGNQAKGGVKADESKPDMLVDINSADLSELSELPGIGPKTAEEIIAYRNDQGPFKTVQELENVKGIGTKKISKLKDLVTVKKTE